MREMDTRVPGRPHEAVAGTGRAVMFVRVIAVVSVFPLLLSLAGLWARLGRSTTTLLGQASVQPESFLAQVWVQSGVIVVAIGLYLLFWLRVWPARRPFWIAAVLLGMAVMAVLHQRGANPPGTDELALYVTVVAGAALRPWRAGIVVLLMVAMTELHVLQVFRPPPIPDSAGHQAVAPVAHGTLVDAVQISLASAGSSIGILVTGALTGMLVSFLVRTTAELYAARSGLAQLAVEEERTRLGRDLHDVLGHTLLLMAVKLELAGRLIGDRDQPEALEIREVQNMARDALRDVREVVGGYRQPTLEGELAGAALALEAAGVTMELSAHHGVLTPTLEATCGWLVREGITNVIKHSGASTCQIVLQREGGGLTVRIADDGTGAKVNGTGTGLQGLSERVTALGGTLTAGSAASGKGFQLVALVPVDLPPAHEREGSRIRREREESPRIREHGTD